MGFSRSEYWSGQPSPSPGDLPKPGIEPRSLASQVESLPAELQGKPKNTGVGSLSLLQRSFLTQELNQSLLHCRQVLYQLSYERSPRERPHSATRTSTAKNKKISIFFFLKKERSTSSLVFTAMSATLHHPLPPDRHTQTWSSQALHYQPPHPRQHWGTEVTSFILVGTVHSTCPYKCPLFQDTVSLHVGWQSG